jgi:hypothetical protein
MIRFLPSFVVLTLCLATMTFSQTAPVTLTPQQKWGKVLTPMEVALPDGALAFHFGGHNFPTMKRVTSGSEYSDQSGYGFIKAHDMSNTGNYGWPTTFHQALVYPEKSGVDLEFKVKVTPGKYWAHLTYNPFIRPDMTDIRYQLKLNDWTIMDDNPTPEQFNGEKYLYRFLWTQYSEKPDAVWNNYLKKMYISQVHEINAPDGVVTLKGINQVLYALILVPAEKKREFDQMVTTLDRQMLDSYHNGAYYAVPEHAKPQKQAADGDYLLYVPAEGQTVMPWTGPTADERTRTAIKRGGVPSQRLAIQLAVVPFADLGKSELALHDLKGDGGTIPATSIKGHFKNYRSGNLNKAMFSRDDWGSKCDVTEMVLLPSLSLEMEKGITQNFWLWMQIPDSARPGTYKGVFTFRPAAGKSTDVPVEIEVYNFALAQDLPDAFGMYGIGVDPTLVDDATRKKVMTDRFTWMREIGLNAITLRTPSITKANDGSLTMTYDTVPLEVARAVGMGKNPQQAMMIENLFILGRYIGYRMPGSPGPEAVDRAPGMELTLPGFDDLFIRYAGELKKTLDSFGLPIVANIVDEPREKYVNPWNRNFDDTMKYIALTRKSGNWRVAMNPMRDIDHYVNKDYTPFIDACDVMSTHAWPYAEKIITQTPQKGKTLWLYNCGMDRLTWGFYNWKVQSTGRWEWHFAFPEEDSFREYKSAEWYNPFTNNNGYGPPAPYAKYPGGMLYQSVFLQVAEGINDARYLYTLEKAIAKPNQDAATVEKAKALLDTIRKQIPDYPKVEGLGTGAGVGAVKSDQALALTETWRTQIAELLKVLAR